MGDRMSSHAWKVCDAPPGGCGFGRRRKVWTDASVCQCGSPYRPVLKRMGYRAALQWLLDNDDCSWLDDSGFMERMSISACLVADIYDKQQSKIPEDLRKLRRKTCQAFSGCPIVDR